MGGITNERQNPLYKSLGKLDTKGFVEGNTYDVINGKIILPDGSESNGTYDTIEHINECFYAVFKEVKD